MSKKKTDLEKQEEMQKNVVRHQALWTALAENSIEIDKRLLILSSAALGLLVFIHNNLKDFWEKFFLLCASFFFIVTIIMILLTFRISQEYIGATIEKDKSEEERLNSKSKIFFVISFSTFILGVSLTFLMMLVKLDVLTVIFTFLCMLLN